LFLRVGTGSETFMIKGNCFEAVPQRLGERENQLQNSGKR
jgi:hypothetical protein